MNKSFPTIQEINEYCVNVLAGCTSILDDYWVAFSDFWDINFWSEDGIQHITLYPSEFGNTLTHMGIRIK